MAESAVFSAYHRLGTERQCDIESPPNFDTEEVWRRDADDLKRVAVQRDWLADDGWIAPVLCFPEAVTQHRPPRIAARSIVAFAEHTPGLCTHPERAEEVAADENAVNFACLTARAEIPRGNAKREHLRECLLLSAQGLPQRL